MATNFLRNLQKIDTFILSLFCGKIWSWLANSNINILTPKYNASKKQEPFRATLIKSFYIYIKWKKKFKRILSCLCGGRRKVQVTKIAFEVHLDFFTEKRLSCSETQPSKWSIKGFNVHDFELYGHRNYEIKWEFSLVIYRSCHLLFIYVDVEKTVGKRAQIWGRCSLEYFVLSQIYLCGPMKKVWRKFHFNNYKLMGFRINVFKTDFSGHYFVFVYS